MMKTTQIPASPECTECLLDGRRARPAVTYLHGSALCWECLARRRQDQAEVDQTMSDNAQRLGEMVRRMQSDEPWPWGR